MTPRFIAIEGNIGAGKTTLATLLAEKLNARLVLEEFADNAFLPRFYADPARWAFPLELSFLADRYKQLKDALALPELFAQPIVADYLFIKSKFFARINLDEAEYELFTRLFEMMAPHLRLPEALIYLHAPVETLQAHIRKRGRDYEQSIRNDYLQRISSNYEACLSALCLPVVMIDTSRFDFHCQPDALEALLARLSMPLKPGLHYFEG